MGNLINNPRFRFSFRFSCCTTVISSPEEDEENDEDAVRLSLENGKVDADQRSLEQRQDSIPDPPPYEKT